MMNAINALLAKREFSDVTEGVDSKCFSLTLLAWLMPLAFHVNNAISL